MIEQLDALHFVKQNRKEVKISFLCRKILMGRVSQEELEIIAKVLEMVASHEVMGRSVFSENFYVDLNKKENDEAFNKAI